MKFTKELLEKAKSAESAEELTELAKAEGVELTAEEAEKAFADLHKTGELADDELDNVAGGCYDPAEGNYAEDGIVDNEKDVEYLFLNGQYVEFYSYPRRRRGRITYKYALKTDDGRYEPNYNITEDETCERFAISQCRIFI